VVNLPNVGQIDNLPRGAVVETLGLVDSAGFAPIAIGPLPELLRGVTEVHCHVQKMTLEAALSGNRKLALEALMLDPLCAKLAPSQIRKMGLDLMEATREYLPQFK
jgi:alpha-galactosidase